MNNKDIMTSLLNIQKTVNELIDELNNGGCSNKNNIKEDNEVRNIIKNFVINNGSVLNKYLQQDLFKEISIHNYRKLSLIKLMRELNIEFTYIQDSKLWKDIKIIDFYDELETVNDLNN